jgi:hypothetical protein
LNDALLSREHLGQTKPSLKQSILREFEDEKAASGSSGQSSDKENSNIRINQNARALPSKKLSNCSKIKTETRNISPNINKSNTKVGLSAQHSKGIRQAPVFKGLSSVLQSSAV